MSHNHDTLFAVRPQIKRVWSLRRVWVLWPEMVQLAQICPMT